jgi:hypothetical protein
MKFLGKERLCTLLALLSLGALLAACGSEAPTGQTVKTANGVDTTSTPTVGLNICTGCHTVETADWMLSKHANVVPTGNLYSQGVPSLGGIAPAGCANCHDPQGDSARLVAGYTGNVARPVIGCESCHGGGKLHVDQGGVGPIGFTSKDAGSIGSTQVSAQFQTCTACHQLLNTAGTGTITAIHDAGGTDPRTAGDTITDTHFATAMSYTPTGTSDSSPVRGYAMDYSSETVCTDCHNPHGTADINRDWAASGHAYTAQDKAAPKQYGPWNHYNWSCNGTDPITCGPTTTSVAPLINDRRYCQRCHTKTGFVAYADALAAGNNALADSLHDGLTSGVAFTYDWKPEMLECKGCHTDNRGTIRNPGAFNAKYNYMVTDPGSLPGTMATIRASARHQYPDVSSSNVCIPCHSGRTSGGSIQALNGAAASTIVDFGNLSGSDAHDFPGAGIMFTALGYEFPGRDYTNPASYRHDQIGTVAVPNTGTGGPCVGCHMYRAGQSASHLFSAVSLSTDGETIVNVSSEVCFNCHAGSSTALAAVAENERLGFNDALDALADQLTIHGFSSTTNWFSAGDTDMTGNTTAKNNLGARFNQRSLGNDPGAFVHNSKYVKRLIYDSIDWMDDNVMNYSTGSTLATGCTITPSICNAMNYLLPNGVRPGAPSERPY